jgi:DNA invertase Pin-like site-specific DNA recombinase
MAPSSLTFGYLLASTDTQFESVELQKQVVERYCQRLGRRVDGVFVDRADSESQRLFNREAGRQLMVTLRRGDHVVVAQLAALASSFLGFARILEQWAKQGVVVHLCQVPRGVFDPANEYCEILIQVLVTFAQHQRRLVGLRTRQGLAVVKSEGRRHSRIAPYGFKWERRGKQMVKVPVPEEQAICAKAAELKAKGRSIDEIRQHFAYELKLKNRAGKEFGHSSVHKMAIRGTEWLKAGISQRA